MKVKFLKTGKEAVVNEIYGIRLIEQGKAVVVAEPKKKDTVKANKEPVKPTPDKNRKKGE